MPADDSNPEALSLSQPLVVVLGRFGVFIGGQRISLAPASQRLLAFVALAGGIVNRARAAGVLWAGVSEERAHVSLRAALTRLGARAPGLLLAQGSQLELAANVRVDLHEAQRFARQIPARAELNGTAALLSPRLPLLFSRELLPGWYDEWVLVEAETWRQLRLHTLEALSVQFAQLGRFAEAVASAQAAVGADPLRESAQAVLIRAHLSEGNQSEALREFERYRRRLHDELGLQPTPRLQAMLPVVA
jgi:DNA-binding SARP family transcriptional activator